MSARDGGGGADDPGGGGRIVGADDQAHAAGAGQPGDLVVHRQVARDDEQAHADLDRTLLDVPAVADDDDGLPGRDVLLGGEPAEGADVHRADADVELFQRVFIDQVQHPGLERAGDVGEPGVHPAHEAGLAQPRGEEAAELKDRQGTGDAAVRVEHGQDADIMVLDQFERFGAGGILRDGDDVGDHEVAHPGSDIAHIKGERLVETRQDGIDAGIGVAAARGDVTGFAPRLLEGRVGDGRADGVGVGIPVADDVSDAGGGREGRDGHFWPSTWPRQPTWQRKTARAPSPGRPVAHSGATGNVPASLAMTEFRP